MNLLATKKYAAGLINLDPSAVWEIPITEAKNIVISYDGHLLSKYTAEKILIVNDPLAPVKSYR